jgi:alcohol dehydrogenase (cytochrome c)
MGTLDAHLLAIDAFTGKLIWNTTVADAVDPTCKTELAGQRLCYVITHAPLIVKDKVIVGTAGGDGDAGQGVRGFIAAFNVITGKEVWRFSTIPGLGEPGHETWPGDSWKTGGAGIWNTGAYDPELNLTYWGTGNPAPAYGFEARAKQAGDTRLGDNLYSDSVVALDADTGRLKWYYQFTPHDEWDWDSAQVPVLTDIEWQGRSRKVMLWANRNGLMYVLDRITGQFLLGKPFVDVNWMSGFDAKGRPVRTIAPVYDSTDATNWFPPSYSPSTGLFYIAARERARTQRPRASYGAMRAFDPKTGDKKWEFKRDDAVFTAGALTTASNLLFTGVGGGSDTSDAARLIDRYFYALDARTGDLLWQTRLGGSVQSGPMSYAVAGKQYVAVAAGNTLFVFALP